MPSMYKSFILYFLCGFAILGWWTLAFRQSFQSPLIVTSHSQFKPFPDNYQNISLSKLRRKTLHQALAGDYSLMARLIYDWEIDACLLESHGVKAIKHLSLQDVYISQQLAREIKKNKPVTPTRYLPQTYASASLLLALLPPDQIIALPKGLKEEEQLYPKELTSKIPLTIDRHHSEELFLARPTSAFVSASYSHPAMLETLTRQGINLIPLQHTQNVNDILQMVLLLGQEVDRPLQAKLLTLFIEASLLAIDNRLACLNNSSEWKALYVNYYSRYYHPSPSTTTWELLKRLNLQPKEHSSTLDLEHLLEIDPDYLIISSDQAPMANYPISELEAAKNGRLFYIEDKIQQSPTQYIVLAYYDIAQAVAQMRQL
jgi:iron complex transport system substrate-binding protein